MKKILTLACATAMSASYAQVWDSGSGLNWSIPDNLAAGVSWNFTPTGVSGALTQFDIFLNPAHTWRADLIIRLTDPAAHLVTLHNREGSSSDMISVFYADGGAADPAGVNLDSNTTGTLYAPSSGTIGALGQSAGNWTLFASDNGLADTGTIDRIRVHTAPVPEPMSIAVLGFGALALLRRQKKA